MSAVLLIGVVGLSFKLPVLEERLMDSGLVRKRSELLPVTEVIDELREEEREDRPEERGEELRLFLLSMRSPA